MLVKMIATERYISVFSRDFVLFEISDSSILTELGASRI
jgi:hypothetical protein